MLVAVLAACALGGCSHVKPWEREQTARIEQQLEQTDANRAYEEHMWSVREAAVGGNQRVSGGCGCN